MKSVALAGAAALAMMVVSGVAHAAPPGGGPVQPVCTNDDGDEIDCPTQEPGNTGGGGTTSGPGDTGTGGGTSTPVAPSPTSTITFNALANNQAFTTLTEGDYIVTLVSGSITSGFGAYGTRGLDTLGPLAQAYDPSAPTPQFSIARTDGGLFSLDSFFTARLSGNGVDTTTVQGYVGGVQGGSATVVSSFDGFGYPEPSHLSGLFDSVLFMLDTTSSGVSIDNIQLTAQVPEPASWAMMIGGFGLTGAALRRKRKAAVSFG